MDSFYRYWGKAQKQDDGNYRYHLLPYHCLDVAAVAFHLLLPNSKKYLDLAAAMGVSIVQLQKLFAFLMMIHDIGKFSFSFQSLIPEIFSLNFPEEKIRPYDERHDTLGYSVWRGERKNDSQSILFYLSQRSPQFTKFIDLLICTSMGHHGVPPKSSTNGGNSQIRTSKYFSTVNIDDLKSFIAECLILPEFQFDSFPENAREYKNKINQISWQIAGLGILSDWLGSNSDNFPYCSEVVPLGDYWKSIALPYAKKVVDNTQWVSSRKCIFTSIKTLFPYISKPTPLQKTSVEIPLMDGPKLFIVEDVTGAGKTEAAIVLASRIMSKGDADGLYLGLPTMATANAMYNRMCKAYRKLFDDKELPSLILSHGARHLSNEFTETVAIKPNKRESSSDDENASAFCNLWYADNRKKALLADIGIGTIDQALIGILPARHQSLRLLGLNRKVLIIDEVHAYDPYMEHLLNVLLTAHAQAGGSAILLSATLPTKKRIGLIEAFQKGLNTEVITEIPVSEQPFPSLTQYGKKGLITEPLDTRIEVKRSVFTVFEHSYKNVLLKIIEKSMTGQCVCWVRNTVKDARKAYYDLLQSGINSEKIDLFHSRFAMVDRIRIENGALKNFGKTSGPMEREGRILIATQVVEQSLDLDFDIMISDLAPIDLLMQRAGRIHRHVRDCNGNVKTETGSNDDRNDVVLIIFCPEFTENADSTWLAAEHAGTSAVYQNTGVLWRTQKILNEKMGWTMPEDARELIETVYGEGSMFDVCDGLIDNVCKADGKDKSKKAMGDLNALILEKGYCEGSNILGKWDEDNRVSTRLTDENYDLVLGVIENGNIVPYANTEQYQWDWSSLSISLRDWKKCEYKLSLHEEKLFEELKDQYHYLKYRQLVIVNCKSDEALITKERISEYYDPHLGWGAAFTEEV